MAITAPIPLPSSGMDALLEGASGTQNMINSIMNNQLNPYRKILAQAQAQEAQANAMKSRMLANLLNSLVGGGQTDMGGQTATNLGNAPSTGVTGSTAGMINAPSLSDTTVLPPNQSQMISPNQQNIGRAMVASSLVGVQPRVVDGNLITAFGTYKVGQSPQEQETMKAVGQAAGKAESDLTTQYGQGEETQDALDTLHDLMNNPRYQNIAGTFEGSVMGAKPFNIPLGAAVSKVFYPKEDQDLYGQANTAMGKLRSNIGLSFKGSYTKLIGNLVDAYKPNMTDSLDVQKGKLNALETLTKIGQQRKMLVDNYIQQGNSPIQAYAMADQQIPFSQIRETVKNSFDQSLPNAQVGAQANGKSQNQAPVAPANMQNDPVTQEAIKRLAKNIKLPSFKNQQEAKDWFNSQSPMVKAAITLHLKGE